MTLFLKALIGTGVVATASSVAVISSKSYWNNVSNAEATRSLASDTDNLGQSRQSNVDGITDKSTSSLPNVLDARVNSSTDLRTQELEVRQESTPSHSQISSRNLSEAEKYKERLENPELCRLILSSKIDKSKVQACRLSKDGVELEFEYHTGLIGEMPIPVKDLQLTYNQLIVNLTKKDSLGLLQKRFDLSDDIIAGKGLISASDVGDKTFTNKQCKLKIPESLEIQKGTWSIGCQLESQYR